jgi:hypothetical protein
MKKERKRIDTKGISGVRDTKGQNVIHGVEWTVEGNISGRPHMNYDADSI